MRWINSDMDYVTYKQLKAVKVSSLGVLRNKEDGTDSKARPFGNI
jgi:hypothetical protein